MCVCVSVLEVCVCAARARVCVQGGWRCRGSNLVKHMERDCVCVYVCVCVWWHGEEGDCEHPSFQTSEHPRGSLVTNACETHGDKHHVCAKQRSLNRVAALGCGFLVLGGGGVSVHL
jgi:hypothetical protein